MHVVRGRGRRAASLGAGLLLVFQLFSWAAPATPVQAQDADGFANLRGFATGQPAHITALEAGGTRVANAEVAWSAASVDADSNGLNGPKLNEVNREFQPAETAGGDAVTGQFSYARGSGLEAGIATTPPDPNQVVLSALAEQVAPPDHDAPTVEEIAVEELAPLAYASALRGEALANVNDSGLVPDLCVLGEDLSRGKAHATNVQLLDTTATTDGDPDLEGALVALNDQNAEGDTRAVSNSVSRMKLVPNGDPDSYGLVAEVRQTIAPVTIGQTQAVDGNNEDDVSLRLITIELLGEWVLRVFAPGNGPATVHYGPGEEDPEVAVLKIIDSEAAEPLLITTQQLFDNAGLQLPAELASIIDLSVGEDPRAIAAPGEAPDAESQPTLAANGTKASAAVDVVRLRLLSQPDPQAGDIRIGHMEVSAEVPQGGVNCPIPVDKEVDRDTIRIDEEPNSAEFTITVHNAFDCDMTDVVLTDHIEGTEGDPNFRVLDTNPTADTAPDPEAVLTTTDVVWRLGAIPKGDQESVKITIGSATAGGLLRDVARAEATLANCSGEDVSGLGLAGLDVGGLSVPVDVAIETPLTGATATRTMATGGALALVAVALGLILRRRAQHT